MRRLVFWLKYGRRCTVRRPGSLRGPEWTRCIYGVKHHPVYDGQDEHYNGRTWWM